jgi:hypothetical protein
MIAPADPPGRAKDVEACPSCGADFDSGPIPENIRHYYSPPYRWSRRIAVVDRDLDMCVAYRCPDCNHEWPRVRITEIEDQP